MARKSCPHPCSAAGRHPASGRKGGGRGEKKDENVTKTRAPPTFDSGPFPRLCPPASIAPTHRFVALNLHAELLDVRGDTLARQRVKHKREIHAVLQRKPRVAGQLDEAACVRSEKDAKRKREWLLLCTAAPAPSPAPSPASPHPCCTWVFSGAASASAFFGSSSSDSCSASFFLAISRLASFSNDSAASRSSSSLLDSRCA